MVPMSGVAKVVDAIRLAIRALSMTAMIGDRPMYDQASPSVSNSTLASASRAVRPAQITNWKARK